ncbi:glutamate 5-kinase [Oceanomicrobium pacificus]|uniref:Glutamate 5-kinase n=1 Tax=Oceanomicrobium pacificus TaxID=2692916 RepID=A0A6B0TY80_9RHOB|nr:glutamate 5-kinase [Oceanomicrobium pacificus]MXU66242.1 glutamate 5-kinase [Oceanomicrobium pacificus]
MATLTSAALIDRAARIVVKIGSALLVDAETGALRTGWLDGLIDDVAALKSAGKHVVIVSSGSIALGRRILDLPSGALTLEQSQAAASVGQIRLAQAYQQGLARHDIRAGQILMTLEDSENRRRYLNSRATLGTLLELGVVPIVNENDTVATDEIRFGDNDRLAAQIASLAGADVLVLLSDVDGLYTGNPRVDAGAQRLDHVAEVTPEIEAMAGDAGSHFARGGMRTKLTAAKLALKAGCAMAITRGDVDRPLSALANGAPCTWFAGQGDPAAARKRWILAMKPRGRISVDAGAARALRSGKSLLSAGVSDVSGQFERGDPVEIIDEAGATLARGLVGYNAEEARRIKGLRSADIEACLGYAARAALVHRDDMAI